MLLSTARFRKKIKSFFSSAKSASPKSADTKIKEYTSKGREPWTEGYLEYKSIEIQRKLSDVEIRKAFVNKVLPKGYGFRIDERIVEYPWIFSRLSEHKSRILDAGSTFNFTEIVKQPKLLSKELTIATYFPETHNFNANRISYVYADLRELPFCDEWFEEIVSQSTIEHIDMDNSIYGYTGEHTVGHKSYEYLKAVQELIRILKPNGKLLLTFPFGKYEHHGFFQQFDEEMLTRILELFKRSGSYSLDFFRYEKEGWRFAKMDELHETQSYNPHTGVGKLNDGAAHCRSVACIEFIKAL